MQMLRKFPARGNGMDVKIKDRSRRRFERCEAGFFVSFPLCDSHHIFLTIDDKIPEAIVVGIAYGSFDKPVNRRHVDFMPPAAGVPAAESGAVAGLCPVTESNLGDGIFAARAYLAAGGRLGVGTDSNVMISAPAAMNWA